MYPADAKSPKGKLRLLYEGIPMAMIIEQAGGIASTGMFEGKIQRVLDLVPDEIHAKCPIIMGGKRDVQIVMDHLKGARIGVIDRHLLRRQGIQRALPLKQQQVRRVCVLDQQVPLDAHYHLRLAGGNFR